MRDGELGAGHDERRAHLSGCSGGLVHRGGREGVRCGHDHGWQLSGQLSGRQLLRAQPCPASPSLAHKFADRASACISLPGNAWRAPRRATYVWMDIPGPERECALARANQRQSRGNPQLSGFCARLRPMQPNSLGLPWQSQARRSHTACTVRVMHRARASWSSSGPAAEKSALPRKLRQQGLNTASADGSTASASRD